MCIVCSVCGSVPSARGRRLQEAIVSTSLELLALEAEFLQFVVDGCMVVGRLLASSDACCMLLLLLQAVASGEGKVDTVLCSLYRGVCLCMEK